MKDRLRLDALGKVFVSMCATLFPFRKYGNLLYLCCDSACEKIHSVLHSAGENREIMRRGNLINCRGEAAENTHKLNVKGPRANTNHRDTAGGTMMNHASRKETAKRLGQAIHGTYCVIFGSMI